MSVIMWYHLICVLYYAHFVNKNKLLVHKTHETFDCVLSDAAQMTYGALAKTTLEVDDVSTDLWDKTSIYFEQMSNTISSQVDKAILRKSQGSNVDNHFE